MCMVIQKEKSSLGLFRGINESAYNHIVYKAAESGERRNIWCDYCKKKKRYHKEKCWILYPNIKPMKFRRAWKLGNSSAIGVTQINH